MSYRNGLFIGLISVLSFAWATKLYRHFYGLTIADQISMIVIILGVLIVSLRLDLRPKKSFQWLLISIVLCFLYSIYPLLSKLIQLTELSWLLISSFLVISVFVAAMTKNRIKQLILLTAFASILFYPIDFNRSQIKFFDKVVDSYATRKADIQLVKWKQDYWLYYDNQLQYTTVDKHIYQEAYIQPVMQLIDSGAHVLLIGGDNGALESELSKFSTRLALTMLPWDHSFYAWVRSNKRLFIEEFPSKEVLSDGLFFDFLDAHRCTYDLIIIDLPDPLDLAYTQFYSKEFLKACYNSLNEGGFIVSQSGDIFKNGLKSNKIWRTARSVGFNLLSYQTQIPTIGHWSWFVGSNSVDKDTIHKKLADVSETKTKWWNQDAMNLMINSGKKTFSENQDTTIFALND